MIFITSQGQIEKQNFKFDAIFYTNKDFLLIEDITKKSKKTLRDYIINISSWATPSKSNKTFYSDKENWIPFLRVQNITEKWLMLDDVIYISKDVHNWMLKRSQLKPWNLVMTITWRLWSCSVIPKNFVWNINQHSVVIDVWWEKIAKMLATYLNWNLGKKIILSKATWWTRPALDYQAIYSIPIIEKYQIVEKMDRALEIKKQKEKEAKDLLESIDDFVLNELWIKYKEVEEKKIFGVNLSELESTKRFDVSYYKSEKELLKWKYENIVLWDYIDLFNGYAFKSKEYLEKSNTLNFRMSNIRPWWLIDIKYSEKFLPDEYAEKYKNYLLKDWDVVIAMTDMAGEPKILAVPTIIKTDWRKLLQNQRVWKIIFKDEKKLKPEYLSYILICKFVRDSIKWKWSKSVQINLSKSDILSFKIPLPPLDIQEKIAKEVKNRIEKAEILEKEAKEVYERGKREVEEMILEK